MKNILSVLLILCCFNQSISAQEGVNDILKDLYGSESKSTEKNDKANVDENSVISEDIEVYKEYFLSSIWEHLYLAYPGDEKVSRRRMSETIMIPVIHINKSYVSIEALTKNMDIKRKKNKIKSKFILENYATENETKIKTLKVENSMIYASAKGKSAIGMAPYNKDKSGVLVYFSSDRYNCLSISVGAPIESQVHKVPKGSSGFFLQRGEAENNKFYVVTGLFDGDSVDLFNDSFIDDIKI